MNTSFVYSLFSIIGAMVIFLIGMKMMSEALQKVAGSRIRGVLSSLTSNKFKGVTTGFLLTAGIQSSSAVTVMLVSFVNAGLIALPGAIAITLGTNIGTTVTAWLITIVGFNLKISLISLPLIGLSFPLYFSNKGKRKSYGELIIGFALLFLGLEFMKDIIPDIKQQPQIIDFISSMAGNGFSSILIFFLFGIIITSLLQSSSATMALTLVLAFNGVINFELAAAMILGENIGTTVTANIAALVANNSGKKLARVHFLFNLIGSFWVLLLFYPFIQLVEYISTSFDLPSVIGITKNIIPDIDPNNKLPLKLSVFHSLFNVINMLLLIWFIPQLEKLGSKLLIPFKGKEIFKLKYINSGLLSTSELSLVQAKKEITVFSSRLMKMINLIPKLLLEKNDDEYIKLLDTIRNYEKITDNMEIEIGNYITKIGEQDLSNRGTHKVKSMLKMIDDMESIADRIYSMAKTIDKKNNNKVWFNQYHRNNLQLMFKLINSALENMHDNLEGEARSVTLIKALELESQINQLRDKLLDENNKLVSDNEYPYLSGNFYASLISSLEKVGDHILNVNEAIYTPGRK